MSSQQPNHDDTDAQSAEELDETTTSTPPADNKTRTRYETRPTLKPTLLALTVATAVWLAVIGLLLSNPQLVMTADLTEVVEIVVHLLFAFVAIRLFVRLYILRRLSYTVREGRLVREYSLLYRYRRQEVPIDKVRGVEVQRDPIETLLGYGTVSVLSGGVDQGLGFLEFDNVPDADAVATAITETLDE